ncbi:MAG: hypothetical protein MMC33_003054 [Icmadophila ericetorum]|nr:hypothetical protein [Icmadophila ericetorum]
MLQYAGFVNDKAFGINAGEDGNITLTTKKTKHDNRPKAHHNHSTFTSNKSGPKVYKTVVNSTTKQGYRPDLRQAAVARASALRQASLPKKDVPEKKLRGPKAKKAAESE